MPEWMQSVRFRFDWPKADQFMHHYSFEVRMALDKLDLASKTLRWSGAGKLLRSWASWQGILVLNYHRIGEPDATVLDRDLFSARQTAFDHQIGFLKANFDIIVPSDLPGIVDRGRGQHVLITFDDGYRDNYDLALPVLRGHDVPATFFICTGYVDEPKLPWWDLIAWMIRTCGRDSLPAGQWFDEEVEIDGSDRTAAIRIALAKFKSLPADRTDQFMKFLSSATDRDPSTVPGEELWMTWEMVRKLHAAGMTIGAHTVQHHLLARLSEAEQESEIVRSRDRIAIEIGQIPRAFAYPVGSRSAFTDVTKALLERHGFEHGFSFYGGLQPIQPFDRYDIRRAHVGHVATQTMFQAMTTIPGLFARW